MATNYDFLEMVGRNYEDIKKLFEINSKSQKMDFNEDIFHDSIMKSAEQYKDDANDYKKVKAYLWVAYRTNMINIIERTKPMECFEDLIDFDIVDEEYVPEMDDLYDIVRMELYEEFDCDIVNLWFEHVCNNKKYEELEAISGIHNIHYQFKKIRNFIRNEIPLKNERFNEILNILDRKLY